MTSNVILTEPALRDFAAELARHDAFVFDVESKGEDRGVPHLNTVFWLAIATDGICQTIPFGHPIGTRVIGEHREPRLCTDGKTRNYKILDYEPPPKQLSPGTVFDILRPLFLDERIIKVAHGASFDLASVPKYLGEQVKRPYECNIVLDWVLNENHFSYKLKDGVKRKYGVVYEDKNVGKEVEKHPFAKAAHYAYMDAKYTWVWWKNNRPKIAAEGLEDVYALELDILEIMVAMRQKGTRVDIALLETLREELTADLDDAKGRLFKSAGRVFNINSTPQKQRLLFGPKPEGQDLDAWKLTDGARKRYKGQDRSRIDFQPTDFSTDDEALEGFAGNPVVDALCDFNDTDKLLNTYVNAWLGIDPDPSIPADEGKPGLIYGDRIFAEFVQYGTKTGRFSGRNPNLQNIPTRTEQGKRLRYVFIADEGFILVAADYGQIEPRLMAHFIGEGMLFDGFWKGIDPYIVNASAALRKDPDDVTKDERQVYGKVLMLAMGYGAQYRKVASAMRVPEKRAKEILRNHSESMPEVEAYKEAVIRNARKQKPVPYVRTILGRKRRLPELNYQDNGLRMYAERQCFNSKIQGSGADLMKQAMVYVYEGLRDIPDASINLTVHDELVLCGPKRYADDMAAILQEGMTGPRIQKLVRVPLKADVVIGQSWGECK